MAHLIDQAELGTGAAYFGREPAWHRLGTVVPAGADTMTALRLAKADYTVHEAPVYAMTADGIIESTTHKMTYRTNPETGAPQQLGIVGKGQHIKQPRETFSWLDTLLDGRVITETAELPRETGAVVVETAGVLREGKSIFVTCKLPEGVILDPDGLRDPLGGYIFLRDAYDGQSSFTGGYTMVRIVCANTESYALREAQRTFTIQHRSGFEGQLSEARRMLGIAFRYTEAVVPIFEGMARTEVTDAQWGRIVNQLLAPDPKPAPGQPNVTKAAKTINDRRRQTIDKLYRAAANKPITGTVWGAFNAWTEYLDHARDQRQDFARETAVIEEAYASDKGRVARELRNMFPNVDRVAKMSELVAA
jgi:phage/plasmid-like protein (TIGR03299 family)